MYLVREGNIHGKHWIQPQIPKKLWHPTLPAEGGQSESPLSTGAGCPVVPMKQVYLEAIHVAFSQIRFWKKRFEWRQPDAYHEDFWPSHGQWTSSWDSQLKIVVLAEDMLRVWQDDNYELPQDVS